MKKLINFDVYGNVLSEKTVKNLVVQEWGYEYTNLDGTPGWCWDTEESYWIVQ